MLSVQVNQDKLTVGKHFHMAFMRTLRIPDDGREYPLPPGLGTFPICRVEDYADRVPASWREHGGVFIPMYQREALWVNFDGHSWHPVAAKLAVGKINAVSGKSWNQRLLKSKQDYVVVPDQPWLDGINAGDGFIKQFVAMPLGMGYTVEGQLTGKEEFGGIQLIVFDAKPGRFPEEQPKSSRAVADMDIARGMKRLERCLNNGDCSNVVLLNRLRQALEISESQWEDAVAATRRERVEEARTKAVQEEEEHRAQFHPYIFVRTSERRPAFITAAAVIGQRLKYLQLDDAILSLPRPIRLAHVGDLVREHYRENRGKCLLFGDITGYALRIGYEETVVFSHDGSIIEQQPGWTEDEGHAMLMVGKRAFDDGLFGIAL